MNTEKTICVLDNDPIVRRKVSILLSAAGYGVAAFSDGASLLAACRRYTCVCVLLDESFRDASFQLLRQLTKEFSIPVIVASAKASIGMAVDAMKCGAKDFLEKPFDRLQLLDCMKCLIDRRSACDEGHFQVTGAELLTVREREIVALLAAGLTSKEIGRKIGISHRTVEDKRSRIMHKLNVKNVAQLLSLAWAQPASATDGSL